MRSFWVILIIAFAALQYKLWLGDGSIHQWFELEQKNITQEETNRKLKERNRVLASEIEDLKTGHEALEEKARSDLGMIKEGETYYHLVD
jgi:cell division protein FtsB